ncbi:MAG: amino acid adenylation domain-containing protein, partial [Chloroflexota bacterium]
ASVHYVFKEGLLDQLRGASQQYKTSLFALMLAAYKGMLYRLSGSEDIVVGIHTAGQPLAGLPNMVSHCVSILPVRTQPQNGMGFGDYVDQVKSKLLDAQEQQPFTFEQILKHINLPRDPSRSPLVEVLFNLDRKVPDEEFIGLKQTIREIEKEAVNFDLFLNLYEEGNLLKADFIYSTDIYTGETITSWLERFDHLLESIVDDSALEMGDLPLMSGDQKDEVLYSWNQTEVDYPSETLIQTLYEEQAARIPDIPAIVYKDTFLSFNQLNEQANQLARHLQSLGVEPGDNVGISMRRSLDMIVSLLAVIKAGGCYVALDPSYPVDRLAFMIENSEIKTLITKRPLVEHLVPDEEQRSRLSLVLMDEDKGRFAHHSTENLELDLSSESPLYILYTSGSTGVPKGVVGHHRGALNRLSWNWREYPFIEEEVCCQKTTLNFVDSIWEIWGALLKGIPLILIPDDVIGDPKQFVPILENFKIHRLIMVPSILKIMLDDYPDLGKRLPHLKYLHFSGEPVSLELYQQFKTVVPNGVMLNLYGCSELAADATCHDDIRDPITDRVYIGRPIANTKVYVLDGEQNPVPVGVTGEIYVSGAPVAHGYYNRPDLTAERFFADPFVNQGKYERIQMMFRTGDYGRLTADGLVEYLGRSDSQVKIRGIRIELGEIESRLNRHSLIKQSLILVKKDRLGDPALAAYLKVEPAGMDEPVSTWREYLDAALPQYMVPAFFVPMLEFPHTPNGKIDRVGLPDPTEHVVKDVETAEWVAPRDEIEEMLADIWKTSLALDQVGIYEDFFDLGGHSVLAVRMFREVRETFGVALDLTLLFRKATVAGLADEIRDRSTTLSDSQFMTVLKNHEEMLDEEALEFEEDPEIALAKTQKFKAIKRRIKGETLVEINRGGLDQQPFFCVHGGGGNVLFLKSWIKYMDNQPFFAFQSRGIDGKTTNLLQSIEEIAAHYIAEMRQIQQSGPYLIGGYSIGGTIAYEMAKQLARDGEMVNLLALIDTFHPAIQEQQHTMQ